MTNSRRGLLRCTCGSLPIGADDHIDDEAGATVELKKFELNGRREVTVLHPVGRPRSSQILFPITWSWPYRATGLPAGGAGGAGGAPLGRLLSLLTGAQRHDHEGRK